MVINFDVSIDDVESFFRNECMNLHNRVKSQTNYIASNGGLVFNFSQIVQAINDSDNKKIMELGLIINKAFNSFKSAVLNIKEGKEVDFSEVYHSSKNAVDYYNNMEKITINLVNNALNKKAYNNMITGAKFFCLLVTCLFNTKTRLNALKSINDNAILDNKSIENLAISSGLYKDN